MTKEKKEKIVKSEQNKELKKPVVKKNIALKKTKDEINVADQTSSSKQEIITTEVVKTKTKEVLKLKKNSLSTFNSTGKRKRAIAKASIFFTDKKDIQIVINNKNINDYFARPLYRNIVQSPLNFLNISSNVDINVDVFGGGLTGHADAIKLAISKSLAKYSEEYRKLLRSSTFLTRDARKVESKKSGLKKARKKEQFSKR